MASTGMAGTALRATPSHTSVEKGGAASLQEKVSYVSSSHNEEPGSYRALWPHLKESAIVRKIDLRVMPFVFICNFLTFLDRVNISNAALFGLKQDLKLKGDQYNTALLIYFVPYILCEMPSNMLLKHFKPHVWMAICVFGFGFMTIMSGLTKNYSGILAARFFLGFFESGIFPGGIYVVSMWYRRTEAQKRFTLFFSSNMLAGSFAGLLGYAIGHMDGARGLRGWRWIFIIEGVLTCVAACILFFLISDFPEEAKWLNEDEKAFVKARLQDDVGQSGRTESTKLVDILKPFRDWKSYVAGLMYFGLIVPAYSFAYFVPSIIQSYGHTAIITQLLAIPPYFCAFVFGMTISAISDRLGHRFLFAAFTGCIGLAGYIILFVVHSNTNIEYAALYLAAIGTYTAMPLVLCWFNMNVQGHKQRSVATAFQVGTGNVGGIIAAYAFLAKDAPRYIPGYSICIGFSCLAVVAMVLYYWGITRANAQQKDVDEHEDGSPIVRLIT